MEQKDSRSYVPPTPYGTTMNEKVPSMIIRTDVED